MKPHLAKKSEQLGMSVSTARHVLVQDLLFDFICKTGQNMCHHCGKSMTRDTFSIEHKTPWLDSDSPKEFYFDLDNVSYSHLGCNIKAARKPTKGNITHGLTGYTYHKCRCDICKAAKSLDSKSRRNK